MMRILSWLTSLFQCSLLIPYLFKNGEISSRAPPVSFLIAHLFQNCWEISFRFPLPLFISHYIHFQNDEECALGSLAASLAPFSANSLLHLYLKWWEILYSLGPCPLQRSLICLKLMRNALLAPLPPPVLISYYILNWKLWGMFSLSLSLLVPFPLQCTFLITFLLKILRASFSVHSLLHVWLHSYQKWCEYALVSLPSFSVHFLLHFQLQSN